MNNQQNISDAFDHEIFRSEGHKLVDIIADYLGRAAAGDEKMAVLPWTDPDELTAIYSEVFTRGNQDPFHTYMSEALERFNHLHNPRYIGHQVTSPLPLLALTHMATSLMNNGAAVFEMGPVAMAMEKNIIRYFSELIGYDANADGIFTHGGSAGNLTAMLAVRQVKSNHNVWDEGVVDGQRTGFMVTDQSHYSVARNVKIMGLGDNAIIRVPFDDNYRMCSSLLEHYYATAVENGVTPAAVVANACSTATGSYDNLEEIARFCSRHSLWMHVDAAHGAGALFSGKYRHLLNGIELADSVVIDFHKMMLVPGLNTLVMFRDGSRSYETFAQKASYLFKEQKAKEWYNSALRTLECTKSSLGFVAFTAFKYYDRKFFADYIDGRYNLARQFADMVKESADFELAVMPDANIVCFRYKPPAYDNNELNTLNARLRDSIIKEGSFYIVQTSLEEKLFLRITIINPLTSERELKSLLEKIRSNAGLL